MKNLKYILLLTLLTSCSSFVPASEQNISVDNYSQQTVQGFTIRTQTGAFDFTFGKIDNIHHTEIGQAGYSGPMRIKPTDICNILWIDFNGITQTNIVDLRKIPYIHRGDNLLFTLQSNNLITVKPFKL